MKMRGIVLALLCVALGIAGCSSGGSGSGSGGGGTTLPTAATPTFLPGAGSFTAAQNVTISDTIAGAAIYYTTDGTTPTASSTKYTPPITVPSTTTIEAIAVASGFADSAVASGTYSFPGSASPVSVALTTNDEKDLLAAQPDVNFTTSTADAGTNTVVVDSTQQYQTMDGFGADFTDSAAYLLEKVAQRRSCRAF